MKFRKLQILLIILGLGFVISTFHSCSSDKNELVKITILYTNDTHSRIEPFPPNDVESPNIGGFARRAALIKKIRIQENNVLLFDAGDIFQGTLYFNLFKGEPELKLMSEMKYDAATIGNHEFDNGVEEFSKQLENANFPFISSNYDFSKTILKDKILPYKVFKIENIKIGVFGLGINPDGLINKNKFGKTIYNDALEKANEMSYFLKEDLNCDLVICLSHLGYQHKNKQCGDICIAKNTKYINLIIGGHTHTFLEEPTRLNNQDNTETLIVQCGYGGIMLGKLDYCFKTK